MTQIKLSDYVFDKISEYGIDFVPIYPSGNALHLIDSAGTNKKIKEFVNYHEQASGIAAEAYGRFKPFGVCLAGAGPAATNLSTPILSSYNDSIPCLFITGQVGMFHNKKNKNVRQRGFQEVDVVAHMKPITKYSKLVENADDIRYEIEKAIYIATSGRPGPVVLDIPFNVQIAKIDPDKLKSFKIEKKETKIEDDEIYFQFIFDSLKSSKRPVILLGGGVRIYKDTNITLKLLEKLNLPVVTTWGAADILRHSDNLNLGNIGRGGNKSAIYAVQESDLLLSLGCRFTPKEIINEKEFAKNSKIIAIDIDQGELDDALVSIDKKINRDLIEFIPRFNDFLNKKSFKKIFLNNDWDNKIKKLKKDYYIIDETMKVTGSQYVSPYLMMNKLFETANENAIFISDAGMNMNWTYQANRLKGDQRMFAGLGSSPMGYALPASIGAYYATKCDQIIVIAGDGGFQMNIQELQALSYHKLPIKIFIFNNESLGNTRFPSYQMFDGRTTGNENKSGYGYPSFKDVAQAYKIKAQVFNSNTNIDNELKKILNTNEPFLVDVKIDPNQFMAETNLPIE